MHAEILKPMVVLFAWTMAMWFWMYATRIPEIRKLGPDAIEDLRQGRKTPDDLLPARAQWKAHNYNHLHEAPTVFYAVSLTLAMTGAGDGLNAGIAWAYVALRIVHSLVQATVNHVNTRFFVFALSSLSLMALIVQAARVVLM